MKSIRILAFLLACGLLVGTVLSPVVAAPANTEAAAAEARAALLQNVAAQLSAHFRVDGELQLESLRPLVVPSGAIEVDILEYPASLASSMILRVRVPSADPAEQTLVLRAQLLRDVWVSRQPLDRDAPFNGSLLDTRRVDALRERDAIPATEACRDHIFARNVSAGRILTWRDVSRRALVRRGQVIEVSAVDGALSITMKALAMENGAAGDTVKVRNLDTKKEFNALVVADSRALVRF
jgi:flagella basal body P-ring formation protein FlgA